MSAIGITKETANLVLDVLDGMTVHTFPAPEHDPYWDRILDANSKHKIAEAVARAFVGPPHPDSRD